MSTILLAGKVMPGAKKSEENSFFKEVFTFFQDMYILANCYEYV